MLNTDRRVVLGKAAMKNLAASFNYYIAIKRLIMGVVKILHLSGNAGWIPCVRAETLRCGVAKGWAIAVF
jgi:hypothetical protein